MPVLPRLGAVAAAALLVITACSDGDDPGTDQAASSTTSTTVADASTVPGEETTASSAPTEGGEGAAPVLPAEDDEDLEEVPEADVDEDAPAETTTVPLASESVIAAFADDLIDQLALTGPRASDEYRVVAVDGAGVAFESPIALTDVFSGGFQYHLAIRVRDTQVPTVRQQLVTLTYDGQTPDAVLQALVPQVRDMYSCTGTDPTEGYDDGRLVGMVVTFACPSAPVVLLTTAVGGVTVSVITPLTTRADADALAQLLRTLVAV